MASPLTLLAAALPLLSYLDAKHQFAYDCGLISSFLHSRFRYMLMERRGKLSPFYHIEKYALSPADCERPFLIYQGREYSYKEAYELVLKYAAWLRERYNVRKNEIIAMDFTNKPVMIWIWLGLWALGAKPALINYNLEGDRLVHCVKISTARLVFIDVEVKEVLEGTEGEETRRRLETDGAGREVVIFDEATERVVETWKGFRPGDEERDGVKLPDMAMLVYTSGTTGMPKAAVISFQKTHHGASFVSAWLGLKKSDRFYTCMPLYHSSAALLGFIGSMTVGSTLVLGHKFSTKTFWPEVRSSRANMLQYVGETCRYLLAAPPSPEDKNHNVKIAFGNGLRPDVWVRFRERFGIPTIAEFYASTEGTSGSWNIQKGEWGVGAVGRGGSLISVLFGRGVTIAKMDAENEELLRDENGFCIQCGYDEAGEVLWKLDPNNISKSYQGYFRNPKASEEKIVRDVFRKGDAYFRTGDLQRRTRDGLWYFIDRIGDTYRWKSENVSSSEVSEVFGLHPAIAEANVYGVALPNHDGRCGCAAIVISPPTSDDEVCRELSKWVTKLPRFARPIFVRVVKAPGGLEKTGNYKFVKGRLRDEGADPEKVGAAGDVLWWLKDGEYVPFGKRDWEGIVGGKVKL
ncbi:acetyl-CoA synthetase-like protein [Tuber magnatum]|uniref:Very long-chain fatty acid transport protein n=1 Tax=Tuber magnatum TaxID=42249 RepID=A0A317T0K8_9PEZI|nr:acetyl-CoA synthetase-like protein [Tuber magnatum]